MIKSIKDLLIKNDYFLKVTLDKFNHLTIEAPSKTSVVIYKLVFDKDMVYIYRYLDGKFLRSFASHKKSYRIILDLLISKISFAVNYDPKYIVYEKNTKNHYTSLYSILKLDREWKDDESFLLDCVNVNFDENSEKCAEESGVLEEFLTLKKLYRELI